jgi:maltooligosyltrehalose synthase
MASFYISTAPIADSWGFTPPDRAQHIYTSYDLLSWANELYQDKRFPTKAEFNAAYDQWRDHPTALNHSILHRKDKAVKLTEADLKKLAKAIRNCEFDTEICEDLKLIISTAVYAMDKGGCVFYK